MYLFSSGTVERKSVLESRTVSLENLTRGLYEIYVLITISVAFQRTCTKLVFHLKNQ